MLKILFFILLFYFPLHENENDIFIQKATSKPEKLVKCGKFENGEIYINGDTIVTEILKFNKKKEVYPFLFCVIKNTFDSIQILTAKQIDGYSIGNEIFRKHISQGSQFFIRLRKKGRAILYERAAIPSDNRFIYYIKLPNYNDFFMLAPTHDNIVFINTFPLQPGPGVNQFRYYQNPDKQNEKFKFFISSYMGDCEELNSLIASDYFSIDDIPGIIEKYNNCFR